AAPTLEAVNLFGNGTDQILAVDDSNGQVLWLLDDSLGTIRDVVHEDGTLANHITLDSFGNVVEQTDEAFSVRYLLAGREYDVETGLYYVRARYLDPVSGRFISTDPLGPISGDVSGYRYALNSPIQLSDPSGLVVGHQPQAWGSGYEGVTFTEGAQFVFDVAQELPGAVGNVITGLFDIPIVVLDYFAIASQDLITPDAGTNYITIGDFWQREFSGEASITDLLPVVGGVAASAIGGVAGFFVAGPAGVIAGAGLATSIYGAAASGVAFVSGVQNKNAEQVANGVVGFGLSAGFGFLSRRQLKSAKTSKTSGHSSKRQSTVESSTQNKKLDSQSTSANAQADRPVSRSKAKNQQERQARRTKEQLDDEFVTAQRRVASQVDDQQPPLSTASASSPPPSPPPRRPAAAAAGDPDGPNINNAIQNARSGFEGLNTRRPSLPSPPQSNVPAVLAAQRASRVARGNRGLGTRQPQLPPRTDAPPTAASRGANTANRIGEPASYQPKSLWDRSGEPNPPAPKSLATEPPVTPGKKDGPTVRTFKEVAASKADVPASQIRNFLDEVRQISGVSNLQALDITSKFARVKRLSTTTRFGTSLDPAFARSDLAQSLLRIGRTAETRAGLSKVLKTNLSEIGFQNLQTEVVGIRRARRASAIAAQRAGRAAELAAQRAPIQSRINAARATKQSFERGITRTRQRINDILISANARLPQAIIKNSIAFAKSAATTGPNARFNRINTPTNVLGFHLRSLYDSVARYKGRIRSIDRQIARDEIRVRSFDSSIPRQQFLKMQFERLSKRIIKDTRDRLMQQALEAKFGTRGIDSGFLTTVQAVQEGGLPLGRFTDNFSIRDIKATSGRFDDITPASQANIQASDAIAFRRLFNNLPGADGNVYPALLQSSVASVLEPSESVFDESPTDLDHYASIAAEAFSGILLAHERDALIESIDFVWEDLPEGQIGRGLWLPSDSGSWEFQIAVDVDADGHGWFIDETPRE
ncbi:MAG: RHS repeat-associated core domain-containing protein, partial [Planctomycetota bacterium]